MQRVWDDVVRFNELRALEAPGWVFRGPFAVPAELKELPQ